MRYILLFGLLACGGPASEPPPSAPPEPGELQVGVARVRMPVPLGIGTAGFGPFGVQADPSPFSELYPATRRVYTHPDIRAMVISRGDGFEAVFLRVDMVGVFQQVRQNVVVELQNRLGRDLDDVLILGATHTHSGPGRVLDLDGPYQIITDRFHHEFYHNLIHAMADAVEAAFADLAPGRVGFAAGYTDEGINDRRCEDGIYTNGSIPLVAVEQEGALAGVLLTYPIHGTVIGIDRLTLSQDVSGAIEAAVEDRLSTPDSPVLAIMMNSWAADMSPAYPGVALQDGALLPSGYERMDAVGQVVADEVQLAAQDLWFVEEPEIRLRTQRMPINREVMGYADDEFTYPHGGIYCGVGYETDCDAQTNHYPYFDDGCLAFPKDYPAPTETLMTTGRLGPLAVLTFPGEPGTLLAEHVVEELLQVSPPDIESALFIGYAQDFLGYSLLEDDYWLGGYEASGALWGPKQGVYLAGQAVEATRATFDGVALSDLQPLEPFRTDGFEPYLPETPLDLGAVIEDVQPTYTPSDIATLTVAGADPWLGTPVVELIHEDGAPVTRPNGMAVNSDGPAMWIDLATSPTYAETLRADARRFLWTVSLPIRHRVPGVVPELEGRYRLKVRLPTAEGEQEVLSGVFEVSG